MAENEDGKSTFSLKDLKKKTASNGEQTSGKASGSSKASSTIKSSSRTGKTKNASDEEKSVIDEIIDGDDADSEDASSSWKDRLSSIDWKDVGIASGVTLALTAALVWPLAHSAGVNQGMAAQVERAPQEVRSVEGVYSVLDDVNNLKDSQIIALQKEIAAVRDSDASKFSQDEFDGLVKLNEDTSALVDPFFNIVLGIDRNVTKSELNSYTERLSEYTTSAASTSTLYNFLSGATPAKQLNEKVVKTAPVIATWMSSSIDGIRTYLVTVPIATNESTYKASYLVTLNKDKIDQVSFVGVTHDADSPLEDAMRDQIRDDKGIPNTRSGENNESGKPESGNANENADPNANNANPSANNADDAGATGGGGSVMDSPMMQPQVKEEQQPEWQR